MHGPDTPAAGDAPSPELLALAEQIDAQRRVIDERLRRPARWRGMLRRELRGRISPAERARTAVVFDRLVAGAAFERELDVMFLLHLHDRVVGSGELRRCYVRVGSRGGTTPFPGPEQVPELVEAALTRAVSGNEPAPLAAARVHLELLLAHPFVDGNGRVARLLAATVLIRAGYRSTLLTAVEQHFAAAPVVYIEAFYRLAATHCRDVDAWLQQALTAMMRRSAAAAAFRRREQRVRQALCDLGLDGPARDRALFDFDQGRPMSNRVLAALSGAAQPGPRTPRERDDVEELVAQLRRLHAEEAEDSAFPVEAPLAGGQRV